MPPPKTAQPKPAKTIKVGCGTCESTGFHGDDPVRHNNPFCPDCKGAGTLSVPVAEAQDCPACNGRGHVEHVPCPPCGHTGKILPAAPPPPPEPDERDEKITALEQENADLKKQLAAKKTKKSDE